MAKMFGGKETPAEEMAEAKALKGGKISKEQYVKGEKAEGHGKGAKGKADAIKSGKMSPKQYADMHKQGSMKKMADGGMASKCMPGQSGTGRRSNQDYGK